VGDVTVELREDGAVSFENVRSYRRLKDASVTLPDGRKMIGDVAWGGNWFFFTNTDREMALANVDSLTALTMQIRRALEQSGITGDDGATIDHIELVGPPSDPTVADARNFVLCPGGQYDRSPCGTGTSAKVACLAADGKLAPGQVWRQESIVGSIFEAHYRAVEGGILPTITGRAFVNGDLRLVVDARDPFRFGISALTSR
jgi:proline racemase